MNLVCLENINNGCKFFTTNVDGDDPTRTFDGKVSYRVLGYADTPEQARGIIYGQDDSPYKRADLFREYLKKSGILSEEWLAKFSLYLGTTSYYEDHKI